MHIVLVFAPKASATYAPLGITSLAPFIEQTVPDAAVGVLDLNIETWHFLAQKDPEGKDLLDFVQGRQGDFFNTASTLFYKDIWDRLRQQMECLSTQARLYSETGLASAEYMKLLDIQVGRILESDPDLVGFSVLFPEQLLFAVALARAVKHEVLLRKTGKPFRVVFGGAMMSALSVHDLLTAVPEIDGVVAGEGETAAAALSAGADWSGIPGLSFRTASGIIENPKTQTISLNSLPAADFSRLPLHLYFNPVPVLPVLFSRGCSWRKCRFCSHNFAFSGYRKKKVQTFVDEIEACYTTLGARHFYSVDEFIPPPDMDAIAAEITARGLKIFYHVLGKPIDTYTQDRMEKWAASGLRWIGWGVESGSQRLLDIINKGTRVSDIRQVIQASARAGISNLPMMIFGLPTSTDPDMEESFRFLESFYDSFDAMTASAFVLFSGTHFARNARQFGLHIDQPMELLRISGKPLKSSRLRFREISSDGSFRSPRGSVEVAAWKKFRQWLGDPPLLEQLPSEHCLLHLSPRCQKDAGHTGIYTGNISDFQPVNTPII
ncbi:MAG: radical SAM protein [Proteobacteria bacterium]|nr:radical SAM protein [Pseudomonadota bacterium]MBU1386240.1 radical SAM protein [Pseudomonadota bacterium]MBU1542933.1 radical SAM protein [Pseudomonadota bacterium]MBU2481616.1 radical SAM protein [Pseudomonadota bacterium]